MDNEMQKDLIIGILWAFSMKYKDDLNTDQLLLLEKVEGQINKIYYSDDK